MAKRENRLFNLFLSVFKNTGRSIQNNQLMGVASVLSVGAALIILGFFILLSMNMTHITETMESELELKVFLKDTYTEAEKSRVETTLKDHEMVEEVRFESKQEAFRGFSDSLKDHSGLLKGYDENNNPLAASFVVKIDKPAAQTNQQAMEAIKMYAESMEEVDYVKYGEEYVNAMANISAGSKMLSLVVMVILSLVSVFLIYNTIKLTCVARLREIRVMKYVGATDSYIRLPFILEGTLLGLFGAVMAILFIRAGYFYLIAYSNHSIYLPMNATLLPPSVVMLPITVFSFLYGSLIGAFGSLFSIRKFLNV